MRIEYNSEPDDYGKRRFTLFWTGYNVSFDKETERGQCFFANPKYWIEKHGITV